jgi:hypothetical protein
MTMLSPHGAPVHLATLAALAEVAPPESATSAGAACLLAVEEIIRAEMEAVGLRLHLDTVTWAADLATPLSEATLTAAALDLGIMEADTEAALEAALVRLGAALVAEAAFA